MSDKDPDQGKVTLDIADVRKLLGGFGVSYLDMSDNWVLKDLYAEHPAALLRVATAVHEAIKIQREAAT